MTARAPDTTKAAVKALVGMQGPGQNTGLHLGETRVDATDHQLGETGVETAAGIAEVIAAGREIALEIEAATAAQAHLREHPMCLSLRVGILPHPLAVHQVCQALLPQVQCGEAQVCQAHQLAGHPQQFQ